jgi:hypothetical protein
MIRHIFTLLLFSWVPLLGYAQGIPDFSANYLVRINGLSAGELKRELTTAENGLRTFTSQTQAKGIFSFFKPDLIEETSIWSLQENAVHSQTYIYQRTGGKKDKYLSVRFDWNKQQVDIDNTKQTLSLKIQPNTLDKLNYQIALMLDLEQQKKQFSYQIVDKHKLKTHNITIVGTEIIDTPLGKIETVKLKRQRDGKNKRETTLWCAPKLSFLPVKIEHIEKDGTKFTAKLRRLKGLMNADAFNKTAKQANLLLP